MPQLPPVRFDGPDAPVAPRRVDPPELPRHGQEHVHRLPQGHRAPAAGHDRDPAGLGTLAASPDYLPGPATRRVRHASRWRTPMSEANERDASIASGQKILRVQISGLRHRDSAALLDATARFLRNNSHTLESMGDDEDFNLMFRRLD